MVSFPFNASVFVLVLFVHGMLGRASVSISVFGNHVVYLVRGSIGMALIMMAGVS